MSKVVNFTEQVEMFCFACNSCGVQMAMPESLQKQRVIDLGSIYCPNGHVMSYKDGPVERERKARVAAEKNAAFWQSRARDEEAAKAKLETEAARLKKRVGNGICPCCKRTFRQLAAHMKTKHPDYAESA